MMNKPFRKEQDHVIQTESDKFEFIENEFLLNLAFDSEEADELAALTSIETDEYPQISERETQALWKKYAALKRMDEKKSKARHPFRKLIDLVACLILVAGIGLTVAIARNDGFRNQISQMIIGMGQDASESCLNTDCSIHAPNEWKGHYYPAYIPQTLMLSQDESFLMNYVVYRKGSQLLDFGEYTSQDTVWLDTDGTEVEQMNLCHIPVVLYERKYSDGANCLTFVFQPDNCTLILSLQNMTKVEALKVADSVRMIQ